MRDLPTYDHPPRTGSDALARARALVERGRCRDAYARNAAGDSADPTSEDACFFCPEGALRRVLDITPGYATGVEATCDVGSACRLYDAALGYLRALNGVEVHVFADSADRSLSDVIYVMRQAESLARTREGRRQ